MAGTSTPDDALHVGLTHRIVVILLPSTPRHRRLGRTPALIAFLAVLGLLMLLPAAAPARVARAHGTACSSTGRPSGRRARHAASKRRCAKRKAGKGGSGTHRQSTKKPSHKPAAPAVAPTPAGCEDGTLPDRTASGSFSCQDGSEPACEDGSTPTRAARSGTPMCPVEKEPGAQAEQLECAQEASGECPTVEWVCGDQQESSGSTQSCEPGSAGEPGEEPEG